VDRQSASRARLVGLANNKKIMEPGEWTCETSIPSTSIIVIAIESSVAYPANMFAHVDFIQWMLIFIGAEGRAASMPGIIRHACR